MAEVRQDGARDKQCGWCIAFNDRTHPSTLQRQGKGGNREGTFRARGQTARAPPTRQVDGNETAVGGAGDDTEHKMVVCQASAWCRAAAGRLKATSAGQSTSAAVVCVFEEHAAQS